MNLLAGAIIGAITPSWTTRIVLPFFWALLFVGYKWIRSRIKFDTKVIIVEYVTALVTTLLLALLTGSILQLIHSFL